MQHQEKLFELFYKIEKCLSFVFVKSFHNTTCKAGALPCAGLVLN